MGFLIFFFSGLNWLGTAAETEVAPKISLTPLWTIGTDEHREETDFTPNTKVAVSGSGSLYVLDPGNFHVVVFEADGRTKTMFGRKGPGPGEFSEPGAICLDGDEHPVVFDTGKKIRTTFDGEGKVLGEVHFENDIQLVFQPIIFKNARAAMLTLRTGPKFEMLYDLRFYDEKMMPEAPLLQVPLAPLDWSKMREPGFWVDFLTNRFQTLEIGMPVLAPISNHAMVLGRQSAYEGTIYGQDGQVEGHFKQNQQPHFYPEADRRAACEQLWQTVAANPAVANQLTQAVFEKALQAGKSQILLPSMAMICGLGEGFAVLTDYRPGGGTGQLDIFSPSGDRLGRAVIEGHIEAMTGYGRYLYTVGTDSEDRMVISKYSVGVDSH